MRGVIFLSADEAANSCFVGLLVFEFATRLRPRVRHLPSVLGRGDIDSHIDRRQNMIGRGRGPAIIFATAFAL
jgi:hypothetical protein